MHLIAGDIIPWNVCESFDIQNDKTQPFFKICILNFIQIFDKCAFTCILFLKNQKDVHKHFKIIILPKLHFFNNIKIRVSA